MGKIELKPTFDPLNKPETIKKHVQALKEQAKNESKHEVDDPTSHYIRVGTDYFKIIKKADRFKTLTKILKPWKKDEIKLDHGSAILSKIKKYDDFTLWPDNEYYQPVIDNCYNLYHPFAFKPKKGSWQWTQVLLEHVFGEQYDIGLIYLQVLYRYPRQPLPVLVLVSKIRETGKTTFIDWLNAVFGANMTNIEPDAIGNSFNGEYAKANIIAIDETVLDSRLAIEKIKSLATKKYISVNMKFVNAFKLPFFGKIIMASNKEDKFMKIDNEEIRFWVRKLVKPETINSKILNDMIDEIPAFLYHLKNMPEPDMSKSRMVLTPEQIKNASLEVVKEESRSALYKEISEVFIEYFNDMPSVDHIFARPGDIKERFFFHNNQIDRSYIRRVLKNEFNLIPEKNMRVYEIDSLNGKSFIGTPFKIEKSLFFGGN